MSVRARLPRRRARNPDPYAGLPVDELHEPLLPRWFVLLVLATVPVALVVFVVAFFGFTRSDVPVAERRPPPGQGLTSDVGEVVVGEREAVAHDPACPVVEGFAIAGPEHDRNVLAAGLDVLCEAPAAAQEPLAAFADAEPVLRFAGFASRGADVTGREETVYIDGGYAQTQPELLAPLIAYQAVLAQADPVRAETVLAARQAERAACDALDAPGRACDDAEILLGLEDPLAALRAAGFR